MPGTPFDNFGNIARATAFDLGLSENQPISAVGPGRSIIFEEQGVANPRRIILRGRAMPYKGVPWGGTQEHKLTYYPGNPVATLQVLGPRENETEMSGMWKDRFLRDAVVVSDISGVGGSAAVAPNVPSIGPVNNEFALAENVVKLFHGIRRAGTLLRVQWLSEVRFGIISEFEADYDRPQDVRWTMNLVWTAWDDDQSTRSAEEPVPPSQLWNLLNLILQAIALAPEVARAVQASLIGLVEEVTSLTDTLFSLLETIDTVLDTPGAVMGAIMNAMQALDRKLTEMIQRIADVSWPNTVSATAISGPTTSPFSSKRTRSSVAKQELEYARWSRTVGKGASNLRRAAGDAVEARVQRLNPRTTRVVQVSSGTTLYDLSRRFYGSPDFAHYLAQVNRLGGVAVPAGTPVRIPPRPTSAALSNLVMSGGRRQPDCDGC